MSCSFIRARGEENAEAGFIVDGLAGGVATAGVDAVGEHEGAGLGVEHVRGGRVHISCHHLEGDKVSGAVILLAPLSVEVLGQGRGYEAEAKCEAPPHCAVCKKSVGQVVSNTVCVIGLLRSEITASKFLKRNSKIGPRLL